MGEHQNQQGYQWFLVCMIVEASTHKLGAELKNSNHIGVGTTGAPGAGAPLHLAIFYSECLIEIIAKCVI